MGRYKHRRTLASPSTLCLLHPIDPQVQAADSGSPNKWADAAWEIAVTVIASLIAAAVIAAISRATCCKRMRHVEE